MFIPRKPFQLSLMFEGKDGAYPGEAPFTFLAPGVNAIKRFFFDTDIWTIRQECLTQGVILQNGILQCHFVLCQYASVILHRDFLHNLILLRVILHSINTFGVIL